MSELANQIAVVTGAGRGIGRAIALKFAGGGRRRGLRFPHGGERGEGGRGGACAGPKSLGDRAGRGRCRRGEAAAEKILAEAGRVDILVNNAGVTRDGLLMRMSEADWDTVLDTNLKGAFLVTKAFTAHISQAALRPDHQHRLRHRPDRQRRAGNYAASKAGLIGFTKSVARELASRGITANAIAPGFIETDMTAALNEQMRGEVLKQHPAGSVWATGGYRPRGAVTWPARVGGYITGQVLTVDGGMVM